MNKFEHAIQKELKWLDEDWNVCMDLIKKIDAGENVGWSRQSILERAGWADNERVRLDYFINECEINESPEETEDNTISAPKVMTLDEVRSLASLRDGAIWIEALGGLFPALPEISMQNITFFVAIPLSNYRGYFDNEFYGKTWRCWRVRPTPKQRKAVEWK